MKRFLFLLVALSLFVTCAFAESVDLESMTTDEIVDLQSDIIKELTARNFPTKRFTVPMGEYIVGVDIPAGNFRVIYWGKSISCVSVVDANGDYVCMHTLENSAVIGKLPLVEGQTISILYDKATFLPYNGIEFSE